MDQYKPIEAYGIVGNRNTSALVGRDGAIDWCCLPHVESQSVFAAILDAVDGGTFAVSPTAKYTSLQEYVDRTNVLRTTFSTPSGRATLTDWIPVDGPDGRDLPAEPIVYRKLTCETGPVDVGVEFRPRFEYAREPATVESKGGSIVAENPNGEETAHLSATTALRSADDRATAEFSLAADESAWFALGYGSPTPADPSACERSLSATVDFWRDWVHDCDEEDCGFGSEWHGQIVRSELVLKLLLHGETDALCAAPTTSLPEVVGGNRNWDYRYNWIRDTALTMQALNRLGHVEEADDYFEWVLERSFGDDPEDLQPVYGLHGEKDIHERVLSHLRGYRSSAPVRVGNAAADQVQLDIYGEVVLGVYETSRYGRAIDRGDWRKLRDLVDYVAGAWRKPDAGIWEVRDRRRHFVHSKVMCWVALDRAIKIVEATDLDGPSGRWHDERDAIEDAVLDRGFDEDRGCFVRSFGEDSLDATGLLLPVVGFLPADDDRVQGTVDAIRDELGTERGLVRRYGAADGLAREEGAFTLCTFWLVDALALAGRVDEARRHFESVRELASPLGLFSEEIDPETGSLLGNYPQAYSHIGMLNSAAYLRRAEGYEFDEPEPLGAEPVPEELPVAEPSGGPDG